MNANLERPEGNGSADSRQWDEVGHLPCRLSVDLSASGFTVQDLLDLREGFVVDTRWTAGRELPVHVNGVQIGWAEFEAIDGKLSVRLTGVA